jgi:drug/metabolite transporter (DMT)-like permease
MVRWSRYWGAIGVAELLVLGTLFFLFPEPLTSLVGIALVLTAAAVWVAGWYRGRSEPRERRAREEPTVRR